MHANYILPPRRGVTRAELRRREKARRRIRRELQRLGVAEQMIARVEARTIEPLFAVRGLGEPDRSLALARLTRLRNWSPER